MIERLLPGVNVPRGYVCSDISELQEAWDSCLDVMEFVIKPVSSGGNGEGVVSISERGQLLLYDFAYGDVIMQEKLALDCASDGLVSAASLYFMQGQFIGPYDGLADQILVGNISMGFRKSQASKIFQKTCKSIGTRLLQKIMPNGPGSMDFVSVGGQPVLLSFKSGFSLGHIPRMFHDLMCPKGKSFYYWENKTGDDGDAMALWKRLKNAGCHFMPGGNAGGIFPICMGVYAAIGKDENDCMVLHDKLAGLAQPNVPPMPQITQQMQSRYELTLIKNAEAIFAPHHINARHILVGGTQVVGVLDDDGAQAVELLSADISTRIIDAAGCIITPGFVDIHVHITGGGGELGPASRTPEAKVSELIEGGLTTVVGVLGTDCISRSLENLVVKCRALNDEGITSFMWTGAYRSVGPRLSLEPLVGRHRNLSLTLSKTGCPAQLSPAPSAATLS